LRSIRAVLLAALTLGSAGAPAGAAPDSPEGATEADVAQPAESATIGWPADLAAGSAEEPPQTSSQPGASEIERAWLAPAASLGDRSAAARRAALTYGVWSLDAGARAIVHSDLAGGDLERAHAAVRLAPDLPAIRMELARALWLDGGAPIGALRTAWSAVSAIPRHLEASVWFAGCGLALLAAALAVGGLLYVVLAGVFALPHAAHDLGDIVSKAMPAFAGAALLGSLLLLPLIYGEGLLGLALALLVVGVVYGRRGQRIALGLASAAVVIGLYPLAGWAGAVLTGFSHDPVAEAAFSSAGGSALAGDALRLRAAADGDPLAARALARHARRTGSLSVADAHYQALLEAEPDDPVIANNAANVRLELGHLEAALELYRNAAATRESAVVLYNLAQAQGQAFQVEDLAETLSRAQALDEELMAEFTELQRETSEGFVVDLPLPAELMWDRLGGRDAGEPIAAELRAPVAPGWLGRDARVAGGAFGVLAVLGSLAGGRIRPSRWCRRCGRRQCPRCDPEFGRAALCSGCTRLFYQPENTDRALRTERIAALGERQARIERAASLASLAVPGAAGFLAGSPARGLLGSLLFALALAAVVLRQGVVPDPLVAGGTATFLFLHVAAVAALAYAGVVATALAARRSS
jgi:tetratricopeptide (TPR) repeat protein